MKRKPSKGELKKKPASSKSRLQKPVLVGGLIGVLVLAAILVAVTILKIESESVVLQVGDRRISQDDYNSYINELSAKGVSADAAREQLINYYKQKYAQRTANFTIPKSTVNEQREAILAAGEDLSPMQLTMRAQDQAIERTIALAPHKGVDASYVALGYNSDDDSRPWLPSKEEAKRLVNAAHKDAQQGKDQGLKDLLNAYPQQASAGTSFFLEDGSRVTEAGVSTYQGGAISQKQVEAYLKSCKKGLCDVQVDDRHQAIYYMNVIHRYVANIEKAKEYQTAVEHVRVVEYDR